MEDADASLRADVLRLRATVVAQGILLAGVTQLMAGALNIRTALLPALRRAALDALDAMPTARTSLTDVQRDRIERELDALLQVALADREPPPPA
jgi:hypothetical protein